MTLSTKFTCYLCDKECYTKDKGASLGSSIGALREEICTKCVHENYCWATDKELRQHDYSILEARRQGLLQHL